ncbi:DUF4175 family protein [bacterium]|nr:DUF4175 family protein [bacterium]
MEATLAPPSAKLHDVGRRLDRTRSEVRRVLLRHGLAVFASVLLLTLVIFCAIDAFLHVSSGMRLLFLMVTAGLAGWIAVTRVLRPLSASISDLQLALRIERLHPELEEALSSAVAIEGSQTQDARAGSPALRDALTRLACDRSEPIRFDDVIDFAPSRKALWQAGALLATGITLAACFPITSSTAMARLLVPFGSYEWPKRTQFARIDYLPKMAKGDPFTARVNVKGVIPDRLSIEYRFADGQQVPPAPVGPAPAESTSQEPATVDKASSQAPLREQVFLATLDAASQPFEFSIKGGDADSGWLPVEVVPAPDVTRLDVTITPPEYTKLPSARLPEGKGHLKGLVGSRVVVQAESNKPIRTGRLSWEKQSATPGTINEDHRRVDAEFVISQTDTYQIFLEDEQGMTNEHRSPRPYRVEAQIDAPPEVKIEKPTEDMEVTRQAKIPIRWLVRDDFGIQNFDRVYQVDKPGVTPSTDPNGSASPVEKVTIFNGEDRPKQQTVEEEWDLATLDLPQGSVITFRGVARDFRSPAEPNVGESRPIRLLIVSASDFVRQVEAEQKLIREEIQRIRNLEQTALDQTATLAEEARVQGTLPGPSKEKLQTVETTQRRIREKTAGEEDSLQNRIRQLSEKLAANRVNDLDTTKRLSLMDSELGRIQEQHLATIENKLTSARKGMTSPTKQEAKPTEEKNGESNPPAEDLAEAKEHQEQVIESLDAMLDQLDRWESVADVVNEARDVERRQADIAKKVSELASKTLGKDESDLSNEEKGSLAQSGASQEELRQQLHRLERKLAKQAEKTNADDPVAAEAMKEALEKSKQSNLGGQMADAANKIRDNRLTEAGADQNQIAQKLREMVESLENRREQDLKRLVKNLRQAEEDLANIQEEQKRLRKETQEASQQADPQKRDEELRRLGQRQAELRKKAEEFARRLSQLQAKKASQSAGRAASRMNDAEGKMDQGQGDNAGQEQDQAEDQLEEAAQELAEARQEAEEKLANEQLAKVADSIKQIHQRQLAIRDDVARLDGVRQKEGKLTRGQIQSLLGLSRAEKGLAGESAALQEQLAEAKVFRLVIEEAVEQMNKGSERLSEKETGPSAQKPIEKAGNKFAQLIESLRKDPQQKKSKKGNQQGGEGGEGGGGSGQDGIPSIAQIKLLKSLQLEILEETKSLEPVQQVGEEKPEQQQEREGLSKRQGRLADLVKDLMKPTEEGSTEETTP